MYLALLSLLTGMLMTTPSVITDFTAETADLGWFVVNDNVMGGRSDGGYEQRDGEIYFTGSTNTNGGGFSSIRTGSFALDLSQYSGIQLRVKGDGRRYTWRLTTEARLTISRGCEPR